MDANLSPFEREACCGVIFQTPERLHGSGGRKQKLPALNALYMIIPEQPLGSEVSNAHEIATKDSHVSPPSPDLSTAHGQDELLSLESFSDSVSPQIWSETSGMIHWAMILTTNRLPCTTSRSVAGHNRVTFQRVRERSTDLSSLPKSLSHPLLLSQAFSPTDFHISYYSKKSRCVATV